MTRSIASGVGGETLGTRHSAERDVPFAESLQVSEAKKVANASKTRVVRAVIQLGKVFYWSNI